MSQPHDSSTAVYCAICVGSRRDGRVVGRKHELIRRAAIQGAAPIRAQERTPNMTAHCQLQKLLVHAVLPRPLPSLPAPHTLLQRTNTLPSFYPLQPRRPSVPTISCSTSTAPCRQAVWHHSAPTQHPTARRSRASSTLNTLQQQLDSTSSNSSSGRDPCQQGNLTQGEEGVCGEGRTTAGCMHPKFKRCVLHLQVECKEL